MIAASYAQLPKGANQHAANAARFSRKKLAQTFAVSEDTIDRGKILLKSGRVDLIERVKRGASPGTAVRILEVERFGAHVQAIAAGNKDAAKSLDAFEEATQCWCCACGSSVEDERWSSYTQLCAGAPLSDDGTRCDKGITGKQAFRSGLTVLFVGPELHDSGRP
jgi:hypothetical protein